MKNGGKKNTRGFTIIEVVLVLAIAGLIFIMVFVALPALQRSQRDTDRREDMMKFISQVKAYQQSNRGALPGSADNSVNTITNVTWSASMGGDANTWRGFYRDYLGEKYTDPDGKNYSLAVMKCPVRTEQSCNDTTNSRIKAALDGIYDTPFPNDYNILVVLQSTCNGDHTVATSNPRNISVLYRLEGAGVYCSST